MLNATGVVLHTNLGRAPLAHSAVRSHDLGGTGATAIWEIDLPSGAGEAAGATTSSASCGAITGADDALVVNNAAGALVLALNWSVAEGRDVVISRGELIEIGGSFRIPEIMAKSGARLREIGTTNRTHLGRMIGDALGWRLRPILTVHRSNFEQRGFCDLSATRRGWAELAERGGGIPFIYDVGSGLLADLSSWGLESEPRVTEAVASGAGLVRLQWRQAAGWSSGRLLGGTPAAHRSVSEGSAGPGASVGQADPCRTRGHTRALPGS